MGWERGQYYTRSRRVNGRVVREYVGGGVVGALAAQEDAQRRRDRAANTQIWRREQARLDALEAPLAALARDSDIALRAVLLTAGFHEHRGEWRRLRP